MNLTLHRRHIISRFSFVVLIVALAVIGAICAVHAVSWLDKPFPGFLMFEYGGVGSFGDYGWPSFRAGIKYRDVVVEVDGRPVTTATDVARQLEQHKVGDVVPYVFDRNGQRLAFNIPFSRFELNDFLRICVPLFFGGVLFWALGVIVYILKPDTEVTWVFLLLCASIGTYMVTGFEIQSESASTWNYYVNGIALAIWPAAFVHLSLIFPERTKLIQRAPLLPVIAYIVSAFCFFRQSYFFHLAVTRSPSDDIDALSALMMKAVHFVRMYGLVGTLTVVSSSALAFWRSSSVIAKQRSRIVLLGSAIAFMPVTVTLGLMSFFGVVVPQNLFAIFVVAFPLAIAYSISQHNLFDVDVYIKRTLGYVIMTGLVALGYFGIQTVVKTMVLDPLFGKASEQVYPLLFAVLTVFAFNPLSRRVQQTVDKLFFRKRYDYKATVSVLSNALASIVDLNAFIKNVIQRIRQDMFLDKVGVILLDSRQNTCQATFVNDEHISVPGGEKEFPAKSDDPLLALVAREKMLITKYDVAEDPKYAAVYG